MGSGEVLGFSPTESREGREGFEHPAAQGRVLRLVFGSIIGEECAITVSRDGEWLVCLSCPANEKASTCSRSRDLALAVRAVLPCLREYSHVFVTIERRLGVRVCGQYR